mgnify:CR=1 FL=1
MRVAGPADVQAVEPTKPELESEDTETLKSTLSPAQISVADAVNSTRSKDNSMLIITHYQRLLERICPDFVHVFVNGSIIESGGPSLADEIEKNGYERFNNG